MSATNSEPYDGSEDGSISGTLYAELTQTRTHEIARARNYTRFVEHEEHMRDFMALGRAGPQAADAAHAVVPRVGEWAVQQSSRADPLARATAAAAVSRRALAAEAPQAQAQAQAQLQPRGAVRSFPSHLRVPGSVAATPSRVSRASTASAAALPHLKAPLAPLPKTAPSRGLQDGLQETQRQPPEKQRLSLSASVPVLSMNRTTSLREIVHAAKRVPAQQLADLARAHQVRMHSTAAAPV